MVDLSGSSEHLHDPSRVSGVMAEKQRLDSEAYHEVANVRAGRRQPANMRRRTVVQRAENHAEPFATAPRPLRY